MHINFKCNHYPANPVTANITATVNDLCNGGNNGSATVTAGGGTPGYTYNWNPIGGTGATGTGLTAGSYTVTVTDANGCTAVSAIVTITQPWLTPVTANITSTVNVSCNGLSNGSAAVTAGGGTLGYTYIWTPARSEQMQLQRVFRQIFIPWW